MADVWFDYVGDIIIWLMYGLITLVI